ncbi:MAG: hypothetical protein P1R58_06530 [bacterium]|nr:hypothetical protein [bacterium]
MKRCLQNTGRLRLLVWSALFIIATSALAREPIDPKIERSRLKKGAAIVSANAEQPLVEYTVHSQGLIQVAIANNGTFGTFGSAVPDPFTGLAIPSCVYPKNSDIVFLWVGALWVGAIKTRDTLVSCATEDFYEVSEFWPDPLLATDPGYTDGFLYRSIDVNSPFYSPDAYSEEDIICSYVDTVTDVSMTGIDNIDNRPHLPLGIKVDQISMAWSYPYADDFILFDYKIENIGYDDLENVYLGIFVDGDVWHTSRNGPEGWNDDIVGFYDDHPSQWATEECPFRDTINVAFTADNDGDPDNGAWDYRSTTSVVGARVVRTPAESLSYSYNWWIINYSSPNLDFGPRRQETEDDPYRHFGARMGTPEGDANKYYVLGHEEFDYDLMYTAIDQTANGWLRPPPFAQQFASGYDARYLLSFGPFKISPGQKLPVSFAWVGGGGFHKDATDFDDYFDPSKPDIYYSHLGFDSLARNSMWASWVYDNPGVDTDGDGYRGKYHVCGIDSIFVDEDWVYTYRDTFWYEGDRVPDFRGAGPPPAPVFWVEPTVGSFRVIFNGLHSETSKDNFSNIADFEGYRVYIGRDDRIGSYTLVASYDKHDYNKFIVDEGGDSLDVKLEDPPFTLDELRCLYAPNGCSDKSFNPMNYPPSHPFEFGDSLFYFQAQDYNASDFGLTTPIRKTYENQPYPSSLDPSLANPDELTDEGYFKYFEYYYDIEDLLPTVPYYINVTAFDFGSPEAGLAALESSVLNGSQIAYPLDPAGVVESKSLDAYVYPNPYRVDGDYKASGYENRERSLADARARRIHFVNLPSKCTIRIYSIDGDLVREIEHDKDASDPTSGHEEWDLITRNTQAVVSGLYYWVIESEGRTQLGKLAIIM